MAISGTQIITTAYASALEVSITSTQRITKTYYSAGAQLIAMRVITTGGNALYFLHSDHLGSTSLTTNASGGVVARQLYDAWGNVRLRGDVKTDIGYTAQREDRSTNLMFYRARYYSPYLNRWLSPDTIVPRASDPQQLNRYAYGLNNPVKYIDPTGHDVDCSIGESGCRQRVRIEKLLTTIFTPKSRPPLKTGAALEYHADILAAADSWNIPSIVLAAGIDWQAQGTNIDGVWPMLAGISAMGTWHRAKEYFDMQLGAHSYGLGQIRPFEARKYLGRPVSVKELQDPVVSIDLLARKISESNDYYLSNCRKGVSGCSEGERYAVLAIAQNGFGPESVQDVLNRGLAVVLHGDPGARKQVEAITNLFPALDYYGWDLPSGVLDYLRDLLVRTR